jgi:hypothetical protein
VGDWTNAALAIAGAAVLGAGAYYVTRPAATTTNRPAPAGPVTCAWTLPGAAIPNLLGAAEDFAAGKPTAVDIAAVQSMTVQCAQLLGVPMQQQLLQSFAAFTLQQLAGTTSAAPGAAAAAQAATAVLQQANPSLIAVATSATPAPPTGTGRPGSMLIAGPGLGLNNVGMAGRPRVAGRRVATGLGW